MHCVVIVAFLLGTFIGAMQSRRLIAVLFCSARPPRPYFQTIPCVVSTTSKMKSSARMASGVSRHFCVIIAQADCGVIFILHVLPRPYFQIHCAPSFWCVVNATPRRFALRRSLQHMFRLWMSFPPKPSVTKFETREGVPRRHVATAKLTCGPLVAWLSVLASFGVRSVV